MGGRYALLIGNSDYSNSMFNKLKSPGSDVRGLCAVLEHKDIGAFDKVEVLHESTEVEIRRKIDVFFSRRSPDDLLLLYFSGHGVKDPYGRFYLTAVDTDPEYLRSTGISASFIHDVTEGSRARQKIMLIDACFGGAIVKGLTIRSNTRVTREQIVGEKSGLAILTATDAMTYSFEDANVIGDSRPSKFTDLVISGLRTGRADVGDDGIITINDLCDYIKINVPQSLPLQQPDKWLLRDAGDIVIANNPVPKPLTFDRDIEEDLASKRYDHKISAIKQIVLFCEQNPNKNKAGLLRLETLLNDQSAYVREAVTEAILQLNPKWTRSSEGKPEEPHPPTKRRFPALTEFKNLGKRFGFLFLIAVGTISVATFFWVYTHRVPSETTPVSASPESTSKTEVLTKPQSADTVGVQDTPIQNIEHRPRIIEMSPKDASERALQPHTASDVLNTNQPADQPRVIEYSPKDAKERSLQPHTASDVLGN